MFGMPTALTLGPHRGICERLDPSLSQVPCNSGQVRHVNFWTEPQREKRSTIEHPLGLALNRSTTGQRHLLSEWDNGRVGVVGVLLSSLIDDGRTAKLLRIDQRQPRRRQGLRVKSERQS